LTVSEGNRGKVFTRDAGGLGHVGTTKSLMRALTYASIPYNVNPASPSELYDVVYCGFAKSNLEEVYNLLALKKEGYFRKLLLGPIVVPYFLKLTDPSQHMFIDGYFRYSERSRYKVEQDKGFTHCIYPDMNLFSPEKNGEEKKGYALYIKNIITRKGGEEIAGMGERIGALFKATGRDLIEIAYGSYSLKEYSDILKRVKGLIYVSSWETLSLAQAESWAMDVPTFVFDAFDSGDSLHGPIAAAPYLRRENGANFNSEEELLTLLNRYEAGELCFSPRDWLEQNLSERVLANQLSEVLKNLL